MEAMNPHIEYLKQLKACGQKVVAIDYVLEVFGAESHQTHRMPHTRPFTTTVEYLQERELRRSIEAARGSKIN